LELPGSNATRDEHLRNTGAVAHQPTVQADSASIPASIANVDAPNTEDESEEDYNLNLHSYLDQKKIAYDEKIKFIAHDTNEYRKDNIKCPKLFVGIHRAGNREIYAVLERTRQNGWDWSPRFYVGQTTAESLSQKETLEQALFQPLSSVRTVTHLRNIVMWCYFKAKAITVNKQDVRKFEKSVKHLSQDIRGLSASTIWPRKRGQTAPASIPRPTKQSRIRAPSLHPLRRQQTPIAPSLNPHRLGESSTEARMGHFPRTTGTISKQPLEQRNDYGSQLAYPPER
jgi:hypothetical protein